MGTRKEIELAQHYPITFDFAQSWLTPSLKEGIPAMKKRILEALIFLRNSSRLSEINNFQKNRAYQFFWAAHAFPKSTLKLAIFDIFCISTARMNTLKGTV